MRSLFYFARIPLILAVLCAAINVAANAVAQQQTAEPLQSVVEQPLSFANLTNYTEYYAKTDAVKTAQNEILPLPPSNGSLPAPAPSGTEPAAAPQENCQPTCGSCATYCAPCANWTLGIEAVWLSPQYDRPYASYAITDTGRTTLYNYYKGSQPEGLFITPRISLGRQWDCWGVQMRYWRMRESGNRFIPSNGYTDNGIEYCSLFKAETLDLEATRRFCWGNSMNLLSFGVRYAELDQSTGLNVTQEIYGADYIGNAFARHSISGSGLTMAWTGYKCLPCRNFNLFYSLRGSIVWAIYLATNDPAASLNGALDSSPGSLFIGEVQLGAQWNFPLVCNRADAFFRLALEYQYWDTTDTGYTASTSFAGNSYEVGTATAISGDNSTSLIGFTIATGFTW
jgi:hypothetical protein